MEVIHAGSQRKWLHRERPRSSPGPRPARRHTPRQTLRDDPVPSGDGRPGPFDRSAVSAEELADPGEEVGLILEQEAVAGVRVKHQLRTGDCGGQDVVVGDRDQCVDRTVGHQGRDGQGPDPRAGRLLPG